MGRAGFRHRLRAANFQRHQIISKKYKNIYIYKKKLKNYVYLCKKIIINGKHKKDIARRLLTLEL